MKTQFVRGALLATLVSTCIASSGFAEDTRGGALLSEQGADGAASLTVNGAAAVEWYTRLTTEEKVGDAVVKGEYTVQENVKAGPDVICTKTHFTRVANPNPGDHHHGPDSYTVTDCQTRVNLEGKIGLNFDHHDGGDHHGDGGGNH